MGWNDQRKIIIVERGSRIFDDEKTVRPVLFVGG